MLRPRGPRRSRDVRPTLTSTRTTKKIGGLRWMTFDAKSYPVETRAPSARRKARRPRSDQVVSAARPPARGGPVFGVDDSATRQLPVDTFPYQVVFKRFPDRISVLAI